MMLAERGMGWGSGEKQVSQSEYLVQFYTAWAFITPQTAGVVESFLELEAHFVRDVYLIT